MVKKLSKDDLEGFVGCMGRTYVKGGKLATANTLTAIKHGAGRVQGTVNGIGERAGNVALEEVAVALKIREDFFQASCDIVLNETMNTSELVSRFSGIPVPKIKLLLVEMLSLMNQVSTKMVFLRTLNL